MVWHHMVESIIESSSGMTNKKYTMSFTTGGLFHRESVTLAMIYLETGDWNIVREKVISKNLLQHRTLSAAKRSCREIISRLKTLDTRELELIVDGHSQEQKNILWIAICRRYEFISDFAVEVIRERYISLKTDLHHEDFDSFFNRKSEWHVELDKIRPTTRNKLRQVLFKILREADLLTVHNTINAAMISAKLLKAIPHGRRRDVSFFPAFESDVRGMTQ